MADFDLVLRADAAVLSDGVAAAAVGVRDGRVAAIGPVGADWTGTVEERLRDHEVLIPGIVDSHVHVNEPGRTDWEGFATATAAAAVGGVTTILDMPLNSIPPTTTVPALEAKRAAAGPQAAVEVGFWGGAVPERLGRLRELHDAGVFGFKAFLSPSGVDEFPHLAPEQLRSALEEIAAFGGLLIVHAEDPDRLRPELLRGASTAAFVASRPDEAETSAIEQVIDAVRSTGGRAHILHLSSAEALPAIRAAKAEGLPLTVETCPHYLVLEAEGISDGATAAKCCPPVRFHGNREALWAALADGTIDLIASDHSPATAELKLAGDGDFGIAWGGISGLQLSLAAVWTEAAARGFGLTDVVRWMAAGPAAFAGLSDRGAIRVGGRADLVAFAPDRSFEVVPERLQHRNPVSAYAGRTLRGVATATWVGGRLAQRDGVVVEPRVGALLARA